MDSSLLRFMRRRLPEEEARDAAMAVQESLAAQFAATQTTDAGLPWLAVEQPDSEHMAEFDRYFWRLARVRQLDELRRLYVRRRSVPLDEDAAGDERPIERLEARDYLRRLAVLIAKLPEEDRNLLIMGSQPRSAGGAASTNANRVRVHRLRKMLAEQIWLERGTRRDDTDR